MLSMLIKTTWIVSLLTAMATIIYFLNNSKNKKINLQMSENNVMIVKPAVKKQADQLRDKVINELSRQTLVFSEEENAWIRLRQIN